MADTSNEQTAQEKLDALLRDLNELSDYLNERGRHTYELAQRFLENAKRDPSSRSYDERQAVMLDYQHYVWSEIAGLVGKLIVTYGGEAPAAEAPDNGSDQPPSEKN